MSVYEKRLEELRNLYERLRTLQQLPNAVRQQEQHLRDIAAIKRQEMSVRSEALEEEAADLLLRSQALDSREESLDKLAAEKTRGFPWLAAAYEEYLRWQDEIVEDLLTAKDHPAPKAAKALKETAQARRAAEVKAKVLEYKLLYYESLVPWLPELVGDDIEDLLVTVGDDEHRGELDDDPARRWLTDGEYASLAASEKYQLALDRYWRRRKRDSEIGRDYERYVGYMYESQGFSVYYQGIIDGFEDLGRDLICMKDGMVEVVQCKNWSKRKVIHEKNVFQIFGTATAYRIEHPEQAVVPVFYTSTSLSDTAKKFAEALDVKVVEQFPLVRYPCIKCNISRDTEEKIYHLPFDQMYDRTIVEEERRERYADTVAEAEALGFRRALRWRGGEAQSAAKSDRQ